MKVGALITLERYVFRERQMKTLSVIIDGDTHSAEVEHVVFKLLQDGATLRKRPLEWFLTQVVEKYGSLSEATIEKYMDENWIQD